MRFRYDSGRGLQHFLQSRSQQSGLNDQSEYRTTCWSSTESTDLRGSLYPCACHPKRNILDNWRSNVFHCTRNRCQQGEPREREANSIFSKRRICIRMLLGAQDKLLWKSYRLLYRCHLMLPNYYLGAGLYFSAIMPCPAHWRHLSSSLRPTPLHVGQSLKV